MNTAGHSANSELNHSVIIRDFVVASPNTSVTDIIGELGRRQPLTTVTGEIGKTDRQQSVQSSSSCALVMDNNRLVGIVTAGDIVRLVAKSSFLEQKIISEVMTQPVVTLQEPTFTDYSSAITLLQQHSIQHLPLVNSQGKVVGLVTDASLRKNSPLLDLLQWRKVGEVMNHEVTVVSAHTSLSATAPSTILRAIAQQLTQHHLDFVVIVESDHPLIPIGIITKADVIGFLASGLTLEQFSVEKVMCSPLVSVQPTDALSRVQELIAEQAVEQFVVLGEQGELIGVVTEKSFLEALNPLELYKLADVFQGKLEEQVTAQTATLEAKAERETFLNTVTNQNRDSQEQVSRYVATMTDISDRALTEIAFNNIIASTATTKGENFFPALVRHVADALNVSHVLVSTLVDKKLQTIAFWKDGRYQPTFTYSWQQTPCEQSLQKGEFYCQALVQQQFPDASILVKLGVTSYLGVALYDAEGNIIGNLCILDQAPLPEREPLVRILHVFAARAATELERQRTKTLLETLNQNLEAKIQEHITTLRTQEAELQDFFDNAHDLIQSVFLDTGQFQYVNRAWQQVLGYSSAEVNTLTIFDILHPNCQQEFQDVLTAMKAGHLSTIEYLELTFLSKGGQKVIVEGSINCRWEDDQAIATRAIFRDITERKQTEQEKHLLQKRLEYLLHSNPGIIYGCYPTYPFQATFISQNVEKILGYQPADFTEQANFWASRVHPDDAARVLALLSRSFEQETHKNEYRFLHGDGHYIWVRDEFRLIYDEAGNPLEIVGYLADITEQKQAEEKLQQTNDALIRATRLKDEFLATMSHELRTPLNAILGLTEGLREEVQGAINAKQRKALHTIEHSGYHLLELINDLLDLSQIESGNMELSCTEADIAPLCQSVLALFKQPMERKAIQVYTKLPANLPKISIDERRIRQVLINLLSNAVKFTPEGGQIILEASLVENATSLEEPRKYSRALRIAVLDTGIGIAPENFKQLFEPFLQIDSALNRKYQGTGLGLSLVKRIVELHGGGVSVESQPGVGSCFTIDLPLEETGLSRELVTESHSCVSNPSPLILLVEDTQGKMSTVFNYLEAKGYRLVLAENGQQAVQVAYSELPDLMVMDMPMPKMDGLEVMQEIRCHDQLSNMPIIALTTLAITSDRCLQAGANAYLRKPIKMKQLVTLIQELLS